LLSPPTLPVMRSIAILSIFIDRGAPFIRDCFRREPACRIKLRKPYVGLGVDFADSDKAATQIPAIVA
jgi:hypothetical protein